MRETHRITHLFENLYTGHPWIEVTILPTLQQLTARQAAKRIYATWNTIWEITHHMVCWRENVLQRLQGQIIKTPANNYIQPITDTSDGAWQNLLARLERSQEAWIKFMQTFKTKDFEKIYPVNELTYYEHIQGILQHDAYHLGQIVIMAKRVKS